MCIQCDTVSVVALDCFPFLVPTSIFASDPNVDYADTFHFKMKQLFFSCSIRFPSRLFWCEVTSFKDFCLVTDIIGRYKT